MKIKHVSKTERGEYVMITLVGEKKALTLTDELYSSLGEPSVGYELSADEYSELLSADSYYRATKKALNILSFGDNSKRKLYEKLRRGGFSAEICRRTVDDMGKLGYVNEEKQLQRLASALANVSLFGPKRITAKLMNSGYAPEDIRRAISALTECGEIDFDVSFEKLKEKKLGENTDSEAIAKLRYKYGYR